MKAACAAILLAVSCSAQVVVYPSRVRRALNLFDATPGETVLSCDVTPMRPSLNYSFRFQAGYRVSMSGSQFQGKGHGWTELIRITPRTDGAPPVYLVSGQRLPEIPNTKVILQFGGGYLLGEGSYDVNWVMHDDQNRVCRKRWHVDVRLSRAERNVTVAMPRDTVWDVSLRGARLQPRNPDDDAAPLRLTILLHAAPMFQRRTRLRPGDIGTLISAVTTLLEHVPAHDVRLVVFNLEQQKELYRKDDFLLSNMPDVAQSMNSVELSTVDYKVLQNRRGHVELLADLVNREIKADPPPDLVLFLGPTSRYFDRIPAEVLQPPAGRAPKFMNLQIIPVMMAPSTLPDVIRNAIARLGGKTVLVHSPGEFARAIARLEKGR